MPHTIMLEIYTTNLKDLKDPQQIKTVTITYKTKEQPPEKQVTVKHKTLATSI